MLVREASGHGPRIVTMEATQGGAGGEAKTGAVVDVVMRDARTGQVRGGVRFPVCLAALIPQPQSHPHGPSVMPCPHKGQVPWPHWRRIRWQVLSSRCLGDPDGRFYVAPLPHHAGPSLLKARLPGDGSKRDRVTITTYPLDSGEAPETTVEVSGGGRSVRVGCLGGVAAASMDCCDSWSVQPVRSGYIQGCELSGRSHVWPTQLKVMPAPRFHTTDSEPLLPQVMAPPDTDMAHMHAVEVMDAWVTGEGRPHAVLALTAMLKGWPYESGAVVVVDTACKCCTPRASGERGVARSIREAREGLVVAGVMAFGGGVLISALAFEFRGELGALLGESSGC
jgi:hypothetical protein